MECRDFLHLEGETFRYRREAFIHQLIFYPLGTLQKHKLSSLFLSSRCQRSTCWQKTSIHIEETPKGLYLEFLLERDTCSLGFQSVRSQIKFKSHSIHVERFLSRTPLNWACSCFVSRSMTLMLLLISVHHANSWEYRHSTQQELFYIMMIQI